MASWINFGLSWRQETSLCWRLPLLIPIIFCGVICCSAFWLPESAPWLIQKGRIEDARKAVADLRGLALDAQQVSDEIKSIRQQSSSDITGKPGFLDLFKTGEERLLYRTSLSILINFFAQMTGMKASTC